MDRDERTRTEGLVKRAREDPDAFAELFGRVRGRLSMWITLRMGPVLRSKVSVEDVLQETFLQAYRSLSEFEDQGPDSFRRWLFSVAENRLRDMHKFHTRQKRDATREIGASVAAPGEVTILERLQGELRTPSSGAGSRELVGRLTQAISALPDSLREVLIMRAIEECTFQEISDRLGRRRATVQAQFVRALRSLKDELVEGS